MTPTFDWTSRFTVAVEPEGGWQGRPWDHWQLECRFGRVSRVAVIDGEPVVDGEGDEVMEGPGFDHNVVKILPAEWDDEPLPEQLPFHQVTGLLGELLVEAKEVSDAWGHVWVGDDHLALVLAAHSAPGMPALEVMEDSIADFYDGALGVMRLARVRSRLAGEPYLRDPVPKSFTYPIEQLIEANAQRELAVEDLVRLVVEREHSWVSRALT